MDFALVGALFLSIAVSESTTTYFLTTRGEHATAVIQSIEWSKSSTKSVRFRTAEGEQVEVPGMTRASFRLKPHAGDRITVVYDREHPHRVAQLGEEGDVGVSVLFGFLGLMCVVGLVSDVAHRRRRRRRQGTIYVSAPARAVPRAEGLISGGDVS